MDNSTILSGNIKDVSLALNKLLEDNILITSTLVTTLKSYFNEDGSKVIKSDEGSLTLILTYKPK